jgi:hypothetical protein
MRKFQKLRKMLGLVVTFALLMNIMGARETPVSGHELASGVRVRWTVTTSHPTSGRACVLRLEPHSSATSRLVVAATHGGLQWQLNSNNRITSNSGTANVELRSETTVPSHFHPSTAAYVTFRRTDGTWVNTVSNPTLLSGSHNCNYGRIRSYPGFETIPSAELRRAVGIHELGHIVGLGHPTTASTISVMQGSNLISGFREIPQTHDRNDLNSFYG